MANHNVNNPVYHSDLRKYEVTDRGHADVFNANENVLINNDVYLKKEIDTIKTNNTSSDKKLDTHTKDTTAHITAAERQTWNAKASTALATTSANGLMSSSDKSTLNNLSTTISNSISGNKVLTEIKKVDGSGSGLDADLLDGKEASAFALSNHSHNNATTSANGFMSASDKTTLNNVNTNLSSHTSNNTVHIMAAERTAWNAKASTSVATTSTNGLMSAQQVKDLNSVKSAMSSDNLNSTINNTVTSASTINNIFTKIKEVDGAGSKLDADLLDGKEASDFALSNHTHSNATTIANGLMSKEDKSKLDGLGDSICSNIENGTGDLSTVTSYYYGNSPTDIRKNIASGIGAHARGNNCTASGNYSFAEGSYSVASGDNSHSEGASTASGLDSHSENRSEVIGSSSRAEGSGRTYQSKRDLRQYLCKPYFDTPTTSIQARGTDKFILINYDTYPSQSFDSSLIGKTLLLNVSSEGGIENYEVIVKSISDNILTLNKSIEFNAYNLYIGTELCLFINATKNDFALSNEDTHYCNHAEGFSDSLGRASHSEGSCTVTYGSASHAEGENCIAYSEYDHAEGYSNRRCISCRRR